MRKYIACICGVIISIGFYSHSFSEEGNGTPLKYISSCELDLNNDNQTDIAMLVETVRGREVIVLLTVQPNVYKAYVIPVEQATPNIYMNCRFGKFIKEFSGGKKKGKAYTTPGTYIELFQPESSARAYFWDGKGFKEVLTSD
jgi:hypothetical protein